MRLPTLSLSFTFMIAASAILGGCRGGNPLDPDTAMALLKDRNTEVVKFTFSASPPRTTDDPQITRAYDRLIDAHVIQCTSTQAMGKICQPGPAGEAIMLVGANDLSLNAGRWVPSTIVGISRSGSSSAVVEVRMSFEPSPLYRDFESTFEDIQPVAVKTGAESMRNGKTVHATYQRDEEGWHLASVD
jgi:hypothetical protein